MMDPNLSCSGKPLTFITRTLLGYETLHIHFSLFTRLKIGNAYFFFSVRGSCSLPGCVYKGLLHLWQPELHVQHHGGVRTRVQWCRGDRQLENRNSMSWESLPSFPNIQGQVKKKEDTYCHFIRLSRCQNFQIRGLTGVEVTDSPPRVRVTGTNFEC